jgi:hypothetical protein
VAQNVSLPLQTSQLSQLLSQLQQVTLNIATELKHKPEAADIVIQLVLLHCEEKRSTSPPEDSCVAKKSTLSWKREGACDCHH